MDIIGKKYFYFALSLLVVIPGFISILLFGLNLSIDFTGGSRIALSFQETVNAENVSAIRKILTEQKVKVTTIEKSNNLVFIRTSTIDEKENNKFLEELSKKYVVKENSFETIGPTIGAETTANAIKAVIVASILIVLYITWAFRKVPKPASSFKFGVCAIIALIHDVLVVVGIFAILGHFFNVEVDSLFLTAVLTIIGFSVHDTIVVFDRIRENLIKTGGMSFAKIVNDSILQTLDRSLNTSLTVILVLLALLLFGGESIRWFVVALLIGITVGTYSSIFIASPLLVIWEEWSRERIKIK
ncbi:MAG: protein translocase subunit SecF [Candidatus Levybacteria bacterium]|nr:protein translocase subunit SecF [Candidatus Levybacteria bacterium]